MQTSKQRFDKKYIVDENGCWQWIGAVGGSRSPRPQIRVDSKLYYATHIAWLLYRGDIPSGKNVLHDCDNPLCVNPAHLFLGDQQDNMRNASEKGRLGKTLINESIAKWVRQLRAEGKKLREISEITNIPIGTVSNIVSGHRWS